MSRNKQVSFQKGKKPRNQLRLPQLHFVVADDWIDKLGPKAFAAWLKFHTWVDRQDANRAYDKVPYTLEDVAKKLGMGKSTLYRTIIRPLWEYYLIDLVEYEETKRKTQKPMNIVVYESPMNQHETEIQPIEKLRDWEKDYGSAPQLFGRKGGRPKKEEEKIQGNLDEHLEKKPNRFKNETVGKFVLNRFKNKTVYRFKNKTVTVSKMKPNNVSNNLITLSNKPTNESNNNNNSDPEIDRNSETPSEPEKGKEVVVVPSDREKIRSCFQGKIGFQLNQSNLDELIALAQKNLKERNEEISSSSIVDLITDFIQKVNKYNRDKKTGKFKVTGFHALRSAIRDNYQYIESETETSQELSVPASKNKYAMLRQRQQQQNFEWTEEEQAFQKKKIALRREQMNLSFKIRDLKERAYLSTEDQAKLSALKSKLESLEQELSNLNQQLEKITV